MPMIDMAKPDTGEVPNSGPTVASRTCMVVGKLVESAAIGLKQTLFARGLLEEGIRRRSFGTLVHEHIAQHGPLKIIQSSIRLRLHLHWDDEKYQGDAYGAYAWAVYVAEVTVDSLTCEVQIDDFVALQEVGRVIQSGAGGRTD